MKNLYILFLFHCTIIHVVYCQDVVTVNKQDDGYRGIWYFIGQTQGEYRYKYSGGLSTYPANHHPFAVYAPAVRKTFFCYGGASKEEQPSLLHEVGVFDHRNGLVSRPTIVLDKQTNDAHDNPVINIDKQGHIWLFSTSHGTDRPSFIHKSKLPYDITSFERVRAVRMVGKDTVAFDNFSYLQSHYSADNGFFHLMTHYDRGVLKYGSNKPRRTISYITSMDGINWSELKDIALIEEGHYQTSGQHKNKIGTSFNFHPDTQHAAGLDYRTNLYYIETPDHGKSWTSASGDTVALPISKRKSAALIRDYHTEGLNVYINDVSFDEKGNPVIFYITSKGPEPGPTNGPYTWRIAHWNNAKWNLYEVTTSDHNYDMGSLYTSDDNLWHIIGPSEPGPQPYSTGGELSIWTSDDYGRNWTKHKNLTNNSTYNHSYPRRPVNASEEFFSFWADGNGLRPSASIMYFGTKSGKVFSLPHTMPFPTSKPDQVKVSRN
jgi:hypothetical protein